MSIGAIAFYILWPILWILSPLRLRVCIVVLVDGHVLQVKNRFGGTAWHYPGGGIKFGETIQAAAQREAREELHIDLGSEVVCSTPQPILTRRNGLLMRETYVVARRSSRPTIQPSKELRDVRWHPMDENLARLIR
jgi:8-oxo-dGTP pyrophosphatase MutT (NUDIX family)